MEDQTLFPVGPKKENIAVEGDGAPRVQMPIRNQVEFFESDLESLIPDDHQVRTVWAYALESDLGALYGQIKAVEGSAGRTPIDPRLLLALWLYATLRAVGSARELDRLCTEHVAYRWLCGGVSVNYHTLADFRSETGTVFDSILTESVAKLRAAGLVTMDRVAHDGLRVRAHAGKGSFHRKETLERFKLEAEEQVKALKQELHDDPGACSKRQKASRLRAAKEREKRVREAIDQYPDVYAKKKHEKEKARVSVSDPDARVMKMANGGFDPAYNVQLSADTDSQIVVGASVIQSGSDHAQLVPAVENIQRQQGAAPKEILSDGGFAKPGDVEKLSQDPFKCSVYAPPTEFKDKQGKVIPPPKGEGPAVTEWRARMKTPEAQTIYKERAATIECVNALARNRGMRQFQVCSKKKVYAVVLLFALAHNLMRAESLKKQAAKKAGDEPDTG